MPRAKKIERADRSLIYLVIIGIVSAIAIIGVVKAQSSGGSGVEIANCNDCEFDVSGETEAIVAEELEGFLGNSRFQHGIDQLVTGGDVLTTTTEGNTTLTAEHVCDNNVILYAAGTLTTSVTFPATSTLYLDCLKDNGDSRELLFGNTTSTAGSVVTLVAGTGTVNVGAPTTTASGLDTIGTGEWSRLRFTRLGNAAGQILVELLTQADTD